MKKPVKILSFIALILLLSYGCNDWESNLTTESQYSTPKLSTDKSFKELCNEIALEVMNEGQWDGVTIIKTGDGNISVEPFNSVAWDGVSPLKTGIDYVFKSREERDRANALTPGFSGILNNLTSYGDKKKGNYSTSLAGGFWAADVSNYQTSQCTIFLESFTAHPDLSYGQTARHVWIYDIDYHGCDTDSYHERVHDFICPSACGALSITQKYWCVDLCPLDFEQVNAVGFAGGSAEREDEEKGGCEGLPNLGCCD